MKLAATVDALHHGGSSPRCPRAPWQWVWQMERTDESPWEDLVARVREGDPDAERTLVDKLWPRVTQRIHRHCPRRDTVEDLAQEVFLKVFSKLDQFRGGRLEPWVDRITLNVCYDALRKQRVRPEWTFTDVGTVEEETADPKAAQTIDVDAAEIIAALFRRLPDQTAWLLREVELQERSIGEVAVDMGWTQTAARLRLFRARQKLKAEFKQWQEESHDGS